MTSATCRTCLESKPVTSFCPNKYRKCGHTTECRACYRIRRRPADRARQRKNYQTDPELRARKVAGVVAREKSNRKQQRAQDMVRNAIAAGKLTRLPCPCGEKRSEAHHADYNRPLDVMWLCRMHHREWHEKNGPGLNAGDGT